MVEAHEEVEELLGRFVQRFGDGADAGGGQAVGLEDGVDLAGGFGGRDLDLHARCFHRCGVGVSEGGRVSRWQERGVWVGGNERFAFGTDEAA